MKKLLSLLLLLPFASFAQSDTLYVKGGTKYAVTITKIEEGRIHFDTGKGKSSMPETAVERVYRGPRSFPERKDDLIYIEVTESPDEAFVKMGKLIAMENFTITMANKELGVINTGPKPLSGTTSVMLNANIRTANGKTQIVLTGIYDGADMTLYGVTSEQKGPVWHATSSTNSMSKAWDEMARIAKAYGGKVSYGKR